MVACAGIKGGTSNDGKQGRKFFSDLLTPVIQGLLSKPSNEKYQAPMLLLHKNLSLILRIISCNKKIDIESFKKLCEDTSRLLSTDLRWVRICHSIHGPLHHSVELIAMNNNKGLGIYSEEGLEAGNKSTRFMLEHSTRKCDGNKQLEDVHNRQTEKSDPYNRYVCKTFHSQTKCMICNGNDHTVRSHDKYSLSQVLGIEKYLE